MGRKSIGPTAPSRVRTAEKRRQALQLRAAGADFRAIANALGVSVGTAYSYVQSELREITREPAEAVLAMCVTSLDQLQASVWAAARAGDISAVNTAVNH